MGYSSGWSASDWSTYSASTITGKSASTIYSSHLKDAYNPLKITVRESCDSDVFPNSTPIIIGLDVTGSMSRILKVVAEKLGLLVSQIYDRKPVSDPQIMFSAIGDSMCDTAPLQVTQFETDIRIAEQLTDLYFEQGGGGNNFESYPLIWYFADKHTKIDSFDKRGKKGYIFTMGDDGYPAKLTKKEIERFIGDDIPEDISVEQLFNQVNTRYEVFHLMLEEGGTARYMQPDKWRELMGERAIRVTDYTKIPEIIISILETTSGKTVDEVVASWDGSTGMVVRDAISGLTITNNEQDNNGLVEF